MSQIGRVRALALSMAVTVIATPLRVIPASAHVGTLSIDAEATIAGDGHEVTLSGTLVCTEGESGFVLMAVNQHRADGVDVTAVGGTGSMRCQGGSERWTVKATSSFSLSPGPADATVSASMSGADGFDFKEASASVRLVRRQ